MKTARAEWSLDIWVTCPHCDDYQRIDYSSIDEWYEVLGEPCTENKDLDYEYTCDNKECEKEFIINESGW